ARAGNSRGRQRQDSDEDQSALHASHGIPRELRVARTGAPPGRVSQRERRRVAATSSWRPAIHCYPGRRNPQGFPAVTGVRAVPRLTGPSPWLPTSVTDRSSCCIEVLVYQGFLLIGQGVENRRFWRLVRRAARPLAARLRALLHPRLGPAALQAPPGAPGA